MSISTLTRSSLLALKTELWNALLQDGCVVLGGGF